MNDKQLPVPFNEKERIQALKDYNILDTLSDDEFNDIAELISYICNVPIAHVSFMDENRQWFKSKVGFEAVEVSRDLTFCQYTIMNDNLLEVPDAQHDEKFKDHPHVTDGFKVRFYAGIPITTPDGYNIGTICAVDQKPGELNDEQRKALSVLAKHVIALLELRNKNAELDRQTKIAEMAVSAKDRFLANMSHEIRTPMNAIIGFADLLSQTSLSKTQNMYVENVQTAGENLLTIINDILDLSKIESGNLLIETEPFNLKNTLKHVYDLLKVKVSENVEFNLFLDANMPEVVTGDKGRINQIMMNLAGNAIKFTKDGEITISVKKTSETDENYILKFSVKDTGIGIPKNKLDKIFERFSQAEESTTREYGGTGLGLNIVKQLVELQNGEIHVKSEPGRGSEFYFTVNFPKTAEPEIKSEVFYYEPPANSINILLCEDNELNQSLAKSVIKSFGYHLDIANNGEEGVEMFKKNKYDLILMDLQMPVMDGYEATKCIRKKYRSQVPIIAMTAHSLVGEQQKCYEEGMDGYVPKPFKQAELLSTIKKALEKNIDFDFEYLNEMSGGNHEFINEMIGLFINKIPLETNLIENAITEGDYSSLEKLAHSLKSSLSLFKLDKALELTIILEKDAMAKNITSDSRKAFYELKKKLLDTAEKLKYHVS